MVVVICYYYEKSLFLDSGDYSTEKEANLLRFFALQTVSANALRNYMNNQDGTFEEKIKIYCQSVSHESKDLRSRKYV